MEKVIGFELKKLISRIGIYILILLMAGVLVAGVFMYDPIERKDTSLSLTGETVSEMYANFTDGGVKDTYLEQLASIASKADTYINTSNSYMKYNNVEEINKLFDRFDEYCLLYTEASATPSEYSVLLVGINESLDELKLALDTGLQPSKECTGYYILTTNTNYTNLYSIINKIDINFDSPISHKVAGETYYNEYRAQLLSSLNKLIYPNLTSTAQKYSTNGTYYSIINMRMAEIAQKMQYEYEKVVADPSLDDSKDIKNELNTLFNRYVNCVKILQQSYSSSMCVEALNSVGSKTTRSNIIGYGDVSLYEQEELAVEYKYYIENHSNPSDFANSLSVSHTSNNKANAYDFSFFVMALFTVIIVIFAIYLSAHTISGEINNNTMRFTAMRPVKRGSIFFGKYLAILLMSAILLLFGTIASFIVGGIVFGFSSSNILMIINGGWVAIAHPAVVLGLFVLSSLLLVAFYSALTMMLSCAIKSDLLTMIISVIFYAINLILPLFFGIGSWLRFYPFTNINLFAYFGTTSLTSNSVLSKLFNSVVYNGMNIWITLIYIIGITTLLLLIGKTILKKRDL